MPLEPGHQLGPYRVQALLGAGGMGEVYRARDARLGRDVALKVISARLFADPLLRQRFGLEARAASALNHPAVVTIYDVGETDGVSWIAMEWVEGRTLRQVLTDGPLSINDAWLIARQIAGGLAAAHAKGIVHRDLKPENVMLAPDGRAKILDFGLARQSLANVLEGAATDGETVAALPGTPTIEGAILGTVGYMSPEQAAGRAVDFRSDQFALGVLAYEMLSGRRAFEGASAIETLSSIIREDPVPLASIRPGIPESFLQVISRCLAKLPEDRFASTSELAGALDLSPPAVTSTPVTGVTAGGSPQATRPRILAFGISRHVVVALVAAAIVAAAAVAAIGWYRSRVTGAAIESLAVLPFQNTSNDADTDYLGDGLTDALINRMARVPALKVMARGTVFRFKGAADPQDVGRRLGVGAVLTGVVSRRGDRLTISAELIDTASGMRLWGERYDRPFSDLLQVQDAIAEEISDGLRLRLSGDERRTLTRHGTENVEAYEFFMRGRYLLQRDSEEDDLEARRVFERAVALDPRFVEPHLGIVATYARSAGNGYAPPAAAWSHVKEEVRRVLELDPGNVSAKGSLASMRFQFDWDWSGAEAVFREISHDPQIFVVTQYHPIAIFFWARGRPDEAIALMERALQVDPENVESKIMLADFLLRSGRLDDAVRRYEALAIAEPEDTRPLTGLAEAFRQKGDITRAAANLKKAYGLMGEDSAATALASAHDEQDYIRAQETVTRSQIAQLEVLAKERYVSPLDLARLFAQLGDRDKAFSYLDLALSERSPGLVHLKVDPAWDRVRDDRRFAAAVQRVGIP